MSESTTGTLVGGEPPPPGGGAADTREWLPETYRGNPLFADFKDPEAVFKYYENAARLVGVDKAEVLRLPKDPAAAEWADVYAKLGRPDTPDKYELKGPDGLPPDVLAAVRRRERARPRRGCAGEHAGSHDGLGLLPLAAHGAPVAAAAGAHDALQKLADLLIAVVVGGVRVLVQDFAGNVVV
jgi:hypothetical protein